MPLSPAVPARHRPRLRAFSHTALVSARLLLALLVGGLLAALLPEHAAAAVCAPTSNRYVSGETHIFQIEGQCDDSINSFTIDAPAGFLFQNYWAHAPNCPVFTPTQLACAGKPDARLCVRFQVNVPTSGTMPTPVSVAMPGGTWSQTLVNDPPGSSSACPEGPLPGFDLLVGYVQLASGLGTNTAAKTFTFDLDREINSVGASVGFKNLGPGNSRPARATATGVFVAGAAHWEWTEICPTDWSANHMPALGCDLPAMESGKLENALFRQAVTVSMSRATFILDLACIPGDVDCVSDHRKTLRISIIQAPDSRFDGGGNCGPDDCMFGGSAKRPLTPDGTLERRSAAKLARATPSRIRKVEIAMLLKTKGRAKTCRWVRGTSGGVQKVKAVGGKCDRPIWFRATGTTRWKVVVRTAGLPKGAYVVSSRATTTTGASEVNFSPKDRNQRTVRVR